MPHDHLGQAAYRVVEELAVQIGPRTAGSPGEARALAYVENELRKVCRDVRRMAVSGIPAQLSMRLLLMVGMAMLAYCSYWLVEEPRAIVIYVLSSFALPKLIAAARRRAGTSGQPDSANVMGHLPAAHTTQAHLVLCAHLDTARASRLPGELLPRLHGLWMRALMPVVFVLTGAAALRWLDMRFPFAPPGVWTVIRGCGVLFGGFSLAFQLVYSWLARGEVYSPGANDNASGVGVVMALAKLLRDAPCRYLDTHYVLFTAEENGMIGSEQFVKATELPKSCTYVINLDMVGAGRELCYVRGSGLLPPRLTDRGLNTLLQQAYPSIKAHYYFVGSSDFASFVARGFHATSVMTSGNARAEIVYHTDHDTIDHVDVASLQTTAAAVEQAIRLLDSQLGERQTEGGT